jgi:hypothetical protein
MNQHPEEIDEQDEAEARADVAEDEGSEETATEKKVEDSLDNLNDL